MDAVQAWSRFFIYCIMLAVLSAASTRPGRLFPRLGTYHQLSGCEACGATEHGERSSVIIGLGTAKRFSPGRARRRGANRAVYLSAAGLLIAPTSRARQTGPSHSKRALTDGPRRAIPVARLGHLSPNGLL